MDKVKKKRLIKAGVFVGICLFSQVFLLLSFQARFFKNLDQDLFDYKLRYTNEDKKTHDDIVIISIDDRSIDALKKDFGRFPWNRAVYGQFIDYLGRKGVNRIYFDVKFTTYSTPPEDVEVDPNDPFALRIDQNDEELRASTDSYRDLVVHAALIENDAEYEDNTHLLNIPVNPELGHLLLPNRSTLSEHNIVYYPYQELLESTAHLGTINMFPDNDGIYRRSPLLRSYGDYYFKTLSLAPLMPYDTKFELTDKFLKFNNYNIPLYEGEMIINFNKNFKNYSASAVYSSIKSENDPSEKDFFADDSILRGKDVFLGATAVGLLDVKNTAFGIQPGVFLHASILNSFKTGEFITKAPRSVAFIISLLMSLILAWVVIYQDEALIKVIFFLVINGLYFFGAITAFDNKYLWMPSGYILSTSGIVFLLSYMYRTFYENKDKRFLKTAFKNYISPEVIEQIHATGELPKLGGDIGIRSAFFTDIANFSSFSEKLNPEDLVALINEYLTEMTEILLEERGTLDKFVGDAIIAFFGAPQKLEDHAARACRVALKMQEKHAKLRKYWSSEGDRWSDDIKNMVMRIGINSGNILTGNIGAKGRMNYTMMGDAVNLAARLESSAKQYGILNHISEKTVELAGEDFLFRKLDKIVVKGKTEPITTFELIGFKGHEKEQTKLVELFHAGLVHYDARNFSEAKTSFEESLKLEAFRFLDIETSTNPSEVYIKRCDEYLKNPPPPTWDGIFVMTSK